MNSIGSLLPIIFSGFAAFLVGGILIFVGKKAQRERILYNSAKSALITGIKHIKGDTAVTYGKLYVIAGFGFIGVGALMLLVATVAGMVVVSSSLFKPRFSHRPPAVSKDMYNFPKRGKGYRFQRSGDVAHLIEYNNGKIIRDERYRKGEPGYNLIVKENENRSRNSRKKINTNRNANSFNQASSSRIKRPKIKRTKPKSTSKSVNTAAASKKKPTAKKEEKNDDELDVFGNKKGEENIFGDDDDEEEVSNEEFAKKLKAERERRKKEAQKERIRKKIEAARKKFKKDR